MTIGRGFVAVATSDTTDIAKSDTGKFPIAFRFGTGGTAVIEGLDGSAGTFTNIANGETIPCAGRRIRTTGSTGIANIIGIYE